MNNKIITVIGLGYVGLPLAVEMGKKLKTYGYDISKKRIDELKRNLDSTNELNSSEIKRSKNLNFTNNVNSISKSDFIIVTVPTPVTSKFKPDFKMLKNACKIIGQNLKKKSIIVFESTVYPGATSKVCIPIIEKFSKTKWKKDFYVGYSPERTNVGDKSKSLRKVTKLISGDTNQTLKKIKILYSIITDNLYETDSIEIAEAAKSLENTQRDVNIAFINEFSRICEKLKINTTDVLEASSTKWNFINFKPGLVGGHCISVDPYYLIFRSKQLNFKPKIIISSRLQNEKMPSFISSSVLNELKYTSKKEKKILVLGLTFKENCSDIRNSKIFTVVKMLKKKNVKITLSDPHADEREIKKLYNENSEKFKDIKSKFHGVILNSPHSNYLSDLPKIINLIKPNGFFFDVKSHFRNKIDKKIKYLSL